MPAPYFCWRRPDGTRQCRHIHLWLPDWMRPGWKGPWDRRESLPAAVLGRIRRASVLLFGPRPNPWRGVDAAVSLDTLRDLAMLGVIDTVAESLSTQRREGMQASVREVFGAVPLPAGVEASLGR